MRLFLQAFPAEGMRVFRKKWMEIDSWQRALMHE